jgi:hypothetical protein
MRREFFDKLSDLRLQERKGCLVIVPSDTDHFLPRLSQFITYSPQTTKQLVWHSISNSRYMLESRLPLGLESLISKKKKNHAIQADHHESSLEGGRWGLARSGAAQGGRIQRAAKWIFHFKTNNFQRKINFKLQGLIKGNSINGCDFLQGS